MVDRSDIVRLPAPGDCGVCAKVCPAGAIDYDQQDEKLTLNVGSSSSWPPGFEPFDPSGLTAYGYGSNTQRLHQPEVERILSPGGPFHGHVQRRSDGAEPQEDRFNPMRGHEEQPPGEHPYCSNFCCMVSLKQAVISPGALGPNLDMALFFTWTCAPPGRISKNTWCA